jgi:mono/diheme cytochrome c family protein
MDRTVTDLEPAAFCSWGREQTAEFKDHTYEKEAKCMFTQGCSQGSNLIRLSSLAVALFLSCSLPIYGAQRGVKNDGDADEAWQVPNRAARRTNPLTADKNSGAGQELYLQECIACHGVSGKGDGAKVKELNVSPADLSRPALRNQSDGTLFWKISQGKSPMPSFRLRFSEKERWMIVNYVRSLAAQEGPGAAELPGASESHAKRGPQELEKSQIGANPDRSSDRSVSRGKELYAEHCADCHGTAGKGDGPHAADLKVNPADLTSPEVQRETDEALFKIVSTGKKPMPAFAQKLSENDLRMIIRYCRTLAHPQALDHSDISVVPPGSASDRPNQVGFARLGYFHVLTNPVPIYGLGAAVLTLFGALLMRNRAAQLVALWLVFLSAAAAWPAYFFGHKAYQQVHTIIDREGQDYLALHMHRADRLIYVFYALGVLALTAVLLPKRVPKSGFPLALLTFSLALVCLGAGAWIAKAGGQIHHPEFRAHSAHQVQPNGALTKNVQEP